MDLPEIGVRGEAVVTGVEPCPAILPGPGKVVLTTFHHASSDLIDLYLSPQPPTGLIATQQTALDALLYPQVSRASVVDQAWERIGVTGNHPIWSEDRHDYVAAMYLRVGERLKNLSGDTVWVQQKLPRPGPTPVYNLEVQDEHVYYVGANGVLAHNAGKYREDDFSDDVLRDNVSATYQLRKLHPHDADVYEDSLLDGDPYYRVHGNSSAATGPHDVYVVLEKNSRELLHFGETGRGVDTRFWEHLAMYKKEGIEVAVQPLRTVEGKAAALALQERFIRAYRFLFGKRPRFNKNDR